MDRALAESPTTFRIPFSQLLERFQGNAPSGHPLCNPSTFRYIVCSVDHSPSPKDGLDVSETVYRDAVERSRVQIGDLGHFPGPGGLGLLELQVSGSHQEKGSQAQGLWLVE